MSTCYISCLNVHRGYPDVSAPDDHKKVSDTNKRSLLLIIRIALTCNNGQYNNGF